MKRSRDKPPPPIARLHQGRLVPVTSYDAKELDGFAEGTEFDLIPRTARSYPQLGTYWKTLTLACEATGMWPHREALHRALKVKLGYVEPVFDMRGRVVGMIPDSTSFTEMPHREFCTFMDAAMKELAEAIGSDPLAWLEEERMTA